MIVTTTAGIDGAAVSRYLGIVTGEVILGTNLFRDRGANFRDPCSAGLMHPSERPPCMHRS
jgi:uncharacterized protein YbjQ (UPF0145 family)